MTGAAPPPRVLHVLEARRGGTSRHVVDVVTHASGFEHHVAVPTGLREARRSGARPDAGMIDRLQAAGATVHPLDLRRQPASPANALAASRLWLLLKRLQPAVVHGHSAVGGAVARLAGAGGRRPVVYTPNGIPAGRAALAAERALGPLTARLIAVSASEAASAAAHRLVPPGRITVIPNGIEPDPPRATGDLRAQLAIPAGAALVGTVTRLVVQKAPQNFVTACAELQRRRPGTHFLLIGMGPLQADLDRAVGEAGLGGYWHQIPHLENAAAALGQLDVFVLLSAFEGLPYTALEAMRGGTPVVLSDAVGNRDAVEDGVSGFLVPLGDPGRAADVIERLLDGPDLRRAVTEAARRRVRRCFDVREMGAALASLYQDLLRDRPRAEP